MSAPVQIAWVKRIDNSRLVRQRHPGSVRECVLLLGLAAVCLGVVLLCAWQHFRYLHHGYQLEKLQVRYEQLKEWNRILQLEEAALRDPLRIDLLARRQLGLEIPEAGQLLPAGSGTGQPGIPVLARVREGRRSLPSSLVD